MHITFFNMPTSTLRKHLQKYAEERISAGKFMTVHHFRTILYLSIYRIYAKTYPIQEIYSLFKDRLITKINKQSYEIERHSR